jgi:hypothetical protein
LTRAPRRILRSHDGNGDDVLSDAHIEAMSPAERRDLIQRLLGNLPLAAIMITGAVRILRLTATRLWFLDPGTPAWRPPLLP